MVLPGQLGGRVGRRREFFLSPFSIMIENGLFYFVSTFDLDLYLKEGIGDRPQPF
jgi:hypothetical protein